jgi:hypothetical protein
LKRSENNKIIKELDLYMMSFIYHIVGFSFIIVIEIYKIILEFRNCEFLNYIFLKQNLSKLVINPLRSQPPMKFESSYILKFFF